MVLYVRARIACKGFPDYSCGNKNECHINMEISEAETAARTMFTAEGWTCVKGQPELCPNCTRKQKDSTNENS